MDKGKQEEVYDLLFSKEADGLRFDYCRLLIGASDCAEIWYSHNEVDGDYAMDHFSIGNEMSGAGRPFRRNFRLLPKSG